MNQERDTDPSPPPASGGIYISRGMRLQIPTGGITISVGDDGTPDMRVNAVNLCIDSHVHWLEIALRHLGDAERAHVELLDSWRAGDGKRKGRALEDQFTSSLQSVVAAAVAIDSFYAMVRRYVVIPEDTLKAWRKNRTSRPRQITEVLRLSFRIGPRTTGEIGGRLKELFKWRDWSVHPAAGFERPVMYEELGVATEWRFVAFRAENAKTAANLALSLIAQLLTRPQPALPELVEHCEGTLQFVTPLVDDWERKYGELYPRH